MLNYQRVSTLYTLISWADVFQHFHDGKSTTFGILSFWRFLKQIQANDCDFTNKYGDIMRI